MIHHLEAGILAHGLNLGDQLIDITFLDQLRRQVRIQHNRDRTVLLRDKTRLLSHVDEQILLRQQNLRIAVLQCQRALCVKLVHRLVAVQLREGFPDESEMSAVFWSDRLELRFEGVGRIRPDIVRERHFLHIQLVPDDRLIEVLKLLRCLDIHGADRLTVLDRRGVSAGTSENDNLQHLVHILFELRIDLRLIRHRIPAEMNALRRILLDAAHDVLINLLRHERNHRRGAQADVLQRGVQRLIGIDLVLLHALCPETLSAAAHIPV